MQTCNIDFSTCHFCFLHPIQVFRTKLTFIARRNQKKIAASCQVGLDSHCFMCVYVSSLDYICQFTAGVHFQTIEQTFDNRTEPSIAKNTTAIDFDHLKLWRNTLLHEIKVAEMCELDFNGFRNLFYPYSVVTNEFLKLAKFLSLSVLDTRTAQRLPIIPFSTINTVEQKSDQYCVNRSQIWRCSFPFLKYSKWFGTWDFLTRKFII